MFTEYSKMSKKQKKIINSQKRTTWNFSPVTRLKPSKKIYSRKRVTVYE